MSSGPGTLIDALDGANGWLNEASQFADELDDLHQSKLQEAQDAVLFIMKSLGATS